MHYTTIEQSKKLAEILPLESADMYYPWYIEEDGDTIESGHRISTPNIGNFITHKVNKMILPCWSLAALLNIVRKTIGYTIYGIKNVYISCELGNFKRIETDLYDNEVDACVAMIEKLHKLKLI